MTSTPFTIKNGATITGTVTATAFSGDGSSLTNVPAGISNVNTVKVTSSSTYTPTAGTKFFTVYACGGGGGSGSVNPSNSYVNVTSGGNGGNTTVKTYDATEMGATASVTIGSGGSAGTGNGGDAGTGGDTIFNPAGTGATITGKGGYGSYGDNQNGSSNGTGLPRHEYTSTALQNGDYVIFGEFGQYGQAGTSNPYSTGNGDDGYKIGGAGGRSAFGPGAAFRPVRTNGGSNGTSAAANSGGGAGGCVSKNQNSTLSGGTGGSGYVIIQEYA